MKRLMMDVFPTFCSPTKTSFCFLMFLLLVAQLIIYSSGLSMFNFRQLFFKQQVGMIEDYKCFELMEDQKSNFIMIEEQKGNQYIVKGENIHKTYLFGLEGVAALRGVSLNIRQGEFVMILGNSGGGKTSLLNILGTIDKLTKGNLQLYSEKIKSITPDEIMSSLRLNYLGFVFQTFNLISSLTALQNVQLPMILKADLPSSEITKRATELLNSVGMGHRLTHYPNQLSGGEQQRVTIARALANKPKMLLLDQPTGDLDSRNTRIVLDILIKLNETQGITLVMVTHDVNLKFLCHRVLKVLDGKIIGEEKIDWQARADYIAKLRNELQKCEQQERAERNEVRGVETYGAVKWLRQKKMREKVEKDVLSKIQLNE